MKNIAPNRLAAPLAVTFLALSARYCAAGPESRENIKAASQAAVGKTKCALKEVAAETKKLARRGAAQAKQAAKKTAEEAKEVAAATKEFAGETREKVKAAVKEVSKPGEILTVIPAAHR